MKKNIETPKSSAKEWIDELQSNPDWSTTYIDWEAVDEIEDMLKAIDIIRKHRFDTRDITRAEWDVLKEVLS